MTEIDSFWEYGDPAGSEARFRTALESAQGAERLELMTQIARTYSLRQRFDEAHATLDEVETELERAGPQVRVRYGLERGRTFNSAGEKGQARSHFMQAWALASDETLDGLAVDAAHMMAITYMGQEEAIVWNEHGLALARTSPDPKAQALIPALLNNSAWDLHDLGRYQDALPLFQEALAAWEARHKPNQIRTAQWSVARCLRSLARYEEALDLLQGLEAEHAAAGSTSAPVFEEMAENLTALYRPDEAAIYSQKAAAAREGPG